MGTPKVPDFGGDWQMPSDAVVTLWQQELEDLSTQNFSISTLSRMPCCIRDATLSQCYESLF